MLALAQKLTEQGNYTAILLSAETGAAYLNIENVEQAILTTWRGGIRAWLLTEFHPDWSNLSIGSRISAALQLWAETSPRLLVVFIDEIDAL